MITIFTPPSPGEEFGFDGLDLFDMTGEQQVEALGMRPSPSFEACLRQASKDGDMVIPPSPLATRHGQAVGSRTLRGIAYPFNLYPSPNGRRSSVLMALISLIWRVSIR